MNPLADQPPEIKDALFEERMRALGAQARTTGEWFDIHTQIVEHSVKRVMEANGDGHLVVERLADRRSAAARVRAELVAHGLLLSDGVEYEGPVVTPGPTGHLTNCEWPRGQWIRLIWPDQSTLEFKGMRALVALSFIMWWSTFHVQFKALTDPKEAARRVVDPHSPEYAAYMRGKAADEGGSGS